MPVRLSNFKIQAPAHVRSGLVQFDLVGIGPTMHELNIVRTDRAPTDLPVSPNGLVDDTARHADFDHLGEREGIDMGDRSTLTVRLRPGHYVLYCNMDGHYMAGMHSELTVP